MSTELLDDTSPLVELYEFKPRPYAIPGYIIRDTLSKCSAHSMTTARGLYGVMLRCRNNYLEIRVGDKELLLNFDEVSNIRDNFIYTILNDDNPVLYPIEIRRGNAYMRLHFTRDLDAPTLIVNGVHMHRISSDIGPLRDAKYKVRAARVRRGHIVLDVCTGLGYTTIASLHHGAERVYTVEVSREVLAMAQLNPWSAKLANSRVKIILADASKLVERLPDNTFDRIIHDPPRFSMAGELYSRDFYRELFRILRPGGILFHYTGEPLRSRGHGHGPIVRGVAQRLQHVGFVRVRYDERAQGVVAVKPRE